MNERAPSGEPSVSPLTTHSPLMLFQSAVPHLTPHPPTEGLQGPFTTEPPTRPPARNRPSSGWSGWVGSFPFLFWGFVFLNTEATAPEAPERHPPAPLSPAFPVPPLPPHPTHAGQVRASAWRGEGAGGEGLWAEPASPLPPPWVPFSPAPALEESGGLAGSPSCAQPAGALQLLPGAEVPGWPVQVNQLQC